MRARLLELLEEARRLGFLGPGPVADQLAHAEALAALAGPPEGDFLDLGSGAGLPGLAVAAACPGAAGVLLDAGIRRTDWLRGAVAELGLHTRLEVVGARAEDAARDPALRERFALVTARSFGPPAVTAECARAFLKPGARLVVSEPPAPDPGRWPQEGLAQLALEGPEIRTQGPATAAIFTATVPADPRWPRRTGIPTKRPLW